MIDSFSGKYRFLSNFWPSPVVFDGVTYPTVEHAYQAAKTDDLAERALILQAPRPGEAKHRGRHVQLRPDWDDVKDRVMWQLLRQKFAHTTVEAAKLLDTGRQPLVEGNAWHDNYWGRCTCGRCGHGQNKLGCMLMEIREALR